MTRLQLVGLVATLCSLAPGCQRRTESRKPQASTQPNATRTSPPISADCPALVADGHEAFAQGYASAKQGDRSKARSYFDRAAKAGLVHGQYQAGRLMFSALFQADAPTEQEKERYVLALTWLFTSAFRGSEQAASYTPDMPRILKLGVIPEKLETPFSDVPREWLQAALANKNKWQQCYKDALPKSEAWYYGTATRAADGGASSAQKVLLRQRIRPSEGTITREFWTGGTHESIVMRREKSEVFNVSSPGAQLSGTVGFSGARWAYSSWKTDIRVSGGSIRGSGSLDSSGYKTHETYLDPNGKLIATLTETLEPVTRDAAAALQASMKQR